jgi:DNA invertase Pin-like site-specific DNA recombinase
MEKQIKAALYIRVSTTDQNTALQTDELPSYCSARGWSVIETYIDKMSGMKDKRPALDKLMADARKRKFNAVVVWKFDRMGRSTSHLLKVLEEFKDLGINFVSIRESVDTTTPMGKLFFTLLAGFAEFERSVTKERCEAGRVAARKRKVRFGRPKADVDARLIQNLRGGGASLRDIAARLGVSKDTVSRAAKQSH